MRSFAGPSRASTRPWLTAPPAQAWGLTGRMVRAHGGVDPIAATASPHDSSAGGASSAGDRRMAWNNSQPMPAATRGKLSAAMKQKWKDPEHRAAVSGKLKGIEPWNKGRTLSEETRRKMSQAKLNHSVSKTTRRRMSAAHKGKGHSQETVEMLSQMMAGQPKSQEHREHIAAGQRRRHAAARVLRAVEAVYAAQGTCDAAAPAAPVTAQVTAAAEALRQRPASPTPAEAGAAGAAELASSSSSSSGSVEAVTANGASSSSSNAVGRVAPPAQPPTSAAACPPLLAYRAGSGSVLGGAALGGGAAAAAAAKKRKLSKAQILAEYKAELREFRALQEELSPWSTAFLEKNGRKPGMQDVAATGIPWLITRYKQYVLLRDRLFTDTGSLRSRLDGALPDMPASQSINRVSLDTAGAAARLAGSGINGAAGGSSAGAKRFQAVMEYKAARRAASGAGAGEAVPSSSAGTSGGLANGVSKRRLGLGDAVLASRDGDLEWQPAGQASDSEGEAEEGGAAAAEAEGAAEGLRSLPDETSLLHSNVPPRVRMAMLAAQEYRQRKAQATKALATAAAVAAKAGLPAITPVMAAAAAAEGAAAPAAPAAQPAAAGAEAAQSTAAQAAAAQPTAVQPAAPQPTVLAEKPQPPAPLAQPSPPPALGVVELLVPNPVVGPSPA